MGAVFDRLGPDAASVALRALLVRDTELERGTTDFVFSAPDESEHAIAWQLRSRADERVDATLAAMLRDERLHPQTRVDAAVALCHAGGPVDVLTDFTLDLDAPDVVRTEVLHRLPRLLQPLPARLHTLLDLPFGDADGLAALTLLASGDAEAPSLALDRARDCIDRAADHLRFEHPSVPTLLRHHPHG